MVWTNFSCLPLLSFFSSLLSSCLSFSSQLTFAMYDPSYGSSSMSRRQASAADLLAQAEANGYKRGVHEEED